MSSMWDRGVLNASSWHGLEEIGAMADADDMIQHGERSGAWPVRLSSDQLVTREGLLAPAKAIVATYAAHEPRVVGVVGARYRVTEAAEWRDLVRAATAAGAEPTGAFSLEGGSRILATFSVGRSNGLATNLMLADSFDGTMRLSCGFTTIRVVCANTLAAAWAQDGKDFAALRHTMALEEKVKRLTAAIGAAIESGQSVKNKFSEASRMILAQASKSAAFDALFPPADPESSKIAQARAEKSRAEAVAAAAMPINRVCDTLGNLGTLWNAATYLVDRNIDGSPRNFGDADGLNSLLFGAKHKRLEEIQYQIEVIMRDGSVERMLVAEATEHGVDHAQIGRSVITDILS